MSERVNQIPKGLSDRSELKGGSSVLDGEPTQLVKWGEGPAQPLSDGITGGIGGISREALRRERDRVEVKLTFTAPDGTEITIFDGKKYLIKKFPNRSGKISTFLSRDYWIDR